MLGRQVQERSSTVGTRSIASEVEGGEAHSYAVRRVPHPTRGTR